MSKNGSKAARLAQYKDIEDSLHSGFAPLYLFVLEQMRTDEFDKLHTLYTTTMTDTAKLLKEVYALFPSFDDLSDEEKEQLSEEISKKCEEDKQ